MRYPSADALTARHGRVRAALDARAAGRAGPGPPAERAVPDRFRRAARRSSWSTAGECRVRHGRPLPGRGAGGGRSRTARAFDLVPVDSSYDETLAGVLERRSGARVGVEAGHMTVGRLPGCRHGWRRTLAPVALVPVDRMVESVRVVKDEFEVGVFRTAAAMLDDVVHDVLATGARGPARSATWRPRSTGGCKRRGFERPSFDTIVASGPNAAFPHARPGDRLRSTPATSSSWTSAAC